MWLCFRESTSEIGRRTSFIYILLRGASELHHLFSTHHHHLSVLCHHTHSFVFSSSHLLLLLLQSSLQTKEITENNQLCSPSLLFNLKKSDKILDFSILYLS